MKPLKARNASPVRMRPADKQYVEKLARENKTTQAEMLHHAVELLKREQQFQDMQDAYAGLSESELAEVRAESLILDKASGDNIQ